MEGRINVVRERELTARDVMVIKLYMETIELVLHMDVEANPIIQKIRFKKSGVWKHLVETLAAHRAGIAITMEKLEKELMRGLEIKDYDMFQTDAKDWQRMMYLMESRATSAFSAYDWVEASLLKRPNNGLLVSDEFINQLKVK